MTSPLKPTLKPGVFLDRDGTLIEEKEYLHRVEDVALYHGVGKTLKRLQDGGFLLFLVTNQSGVGRGYFTMQDVEKVHRHLESILLRDGVSFQKIYVSPESPDQPSLTRKPLPKFLFDARDEFDVDLSQSYMIGDKLIDLECGWNAGLKQSILVRTGYGAEWERKAPEKLTKAKIVDDLEAAVSVILHA